MHPSVSTNGRTFTSVTSDAASARLDESILKTQERAATAGSTKVGTQLSNRKLKDIKTKPASPVKVGSKAPTPNKSSTSSSNPRPELSKKPKTPSSTPGGGGGTNDRLIRKKMTPARLEHFVAWINEMGLWSDEITSENVYSCMQSGVLLCNIIATYIPDDSLQGVHSRALSKATALSNIEKGLTTLWHKKKVAPSLMPSAVSVYEGNKKAVDDLLQEIFVTCVMEDLSKRFEKDIRKINQLLTLFGVPLRGEAMKFPYNTLWDQLCTCSSLVCLLQFAIDNAQLDDDIDPNAIPASQIYRRANTPTTELHNRDVFFSLMGMVNLPIILTYDNFQSKTTEIDFLQYQLHMIFNRFSALSTFLSGSPSPGHEAPFIRRDIFIDEDEGEDFDIIPSESYDTAGDRDSNSVPDDGEDVGSSSSDDGAEAVEVEDIEEEVVPLTFEQYFAMETECLKLRDDLLNELSDAEEIARYLSKREIELFNMEQSILVQQMALEAEIKYYGPALGYSLPQSEPTSPTATPGSAEDSERGKHARELSLGSRGVDGGDATPVTHAETPSATSGPLKLAPLHSYRSASGADSKPHVATESARENGGFNAVSYTAPLHVDDEAEIMDYISQFNKQETYQILKVMHQPTLFFLKENTSHRPLSFYIAVGDDDMLYLNWEPPLSSTGNEAEESAEASMERGRLPMKSVGKLRKNKDCIVIDIKFTLDDVSVLRGTKGLDTITMVTDDQLLCHRYFIGLHLAKHCFAFSNPSVAKELLHYSDYEGAPGGGSASAVERGSSRSKTNPINSENSVEKVNPQKFSVVTRFRGQTNAEQVLSPVSSELTRGVSNSISSHLLQAANKSAGVKGKGFI